jgi:hypothetical protein
MSFEIVISHLTLQWRELDTMTFLLKPEFKGTLGNSACGVLSKFKQDSLVHTGKLISRDKINRFLDIR